MGKVTAVCGVLSLAAINFLQNAFAGWFGNNARVVVLILGVLIAALVINFLLRRREIPTVIVSFKDSKLIYDVEILPYRGIVAIAPPLLAQSSQKRQQLLERLANTGAQDLVSTLNQTDETKQFIPILEAIERCRHLDYVWLITTEAPNKEGIIIDTSLEAELLETVIHRIRSNVHVFKGKGNASTRGINYHIVHNFDAQLVKVVYDKINEIFENELGDKQLSASDVLIEATTGLRQAGFGLLFACLPKNRDILLSVEDTRNNTQSTGKQDSIPILYKFDTVVMQQQS
jgi:hypothetical protein